jgi:hypothetical protein
MNKIIKFKKSDGIKDLSLFELDNSKTYLITYKADTIEEAEIIGNHIHDRCQENGLKVIIIPKIKNAKSNITIKEKKD